MNYKLTKQKLEALSRALSLYVNELEDFVDDNREEIRQANKAHSWVIQELHKRGG
jgi:hypothetical protein